jgi:glycosyltransferase involved in cell wall biosynthesis
MIYSNLITYSKKNINKKNLIFLLPNFKIGGAGNSILKICKNIDYKNYNIFIISLGKNNFKNQFKKYNVNVLELPQKRLFFSINLIRKIVDLISKDKKTIFISNINYSNVIACIFLTKLKNVKIITIERTPVQELDFYSSLNEFIKKKIIKYLIKKTYKYAYLRIGNSKQVSKDLSKLCGCTVKTYLPYINITKNEIRLFSKPNTNITWIGRNSAEKNLDDFINATKLLKRKNIIFNIVTDKPIKTKSKNIKYYKFNNVNLEKIYKKTDILISTSFYEGFPNVIAEAINYNCLIISSKNFGGSAQLIGNSNGLIYEIKNPKDLAKKITYSINNPYKMKKIIIKSKKNLTLLSKKYNQFYQKLFSKM